MLHEPLNVGYEDEEELVNSPIVLLAEKGSPTCIQVNSLCHELSLPLLAAQCLKEIDNYRKGEPYADEYGLELLHRAIAENNHEAWLSIQYCFGGSVRGWLWHHPKRRVAFRFDSEENYVAHTFVRFWQTTTLNQRIEFSSIGAAMQYLHACLNGVILDMLRTYARPEEVSLLELGKPGEPFAEDSSEMIDVLYVLQTIISDPRERRLAYLLYYCGLKPREIVRFCSEEWGDVQEIYRLRHNIIDRIVRNADQLRWKLR